MSDLGLLFRFLLLSILVKTGWSITSTSDSTSEIGLGPSTQSSLASDSTAVNISSNDTSTQPSGMVDTSTTGTDITTTLLTTPMPTQIATSKELPSTTPITSSANDITTENVTNSSENNSGSESTNTSPSGPSDMTSSDTTANNTEPSHGTTSSTNSMATTPAMATTTKSNKYSTLTPYRPMELMLNFSNFSTPDTDIFCNCSSSHAKTLVENEFKTFPGFLYVQAIENNSSNTSFIITVYVNLREFTELSEEDRRNRTLEALMRLNETSYDITIANETLWNISSAFSQMTVCDLDQICPFGYTCSQGVCHHLCEDLDCGGNGYCNVVVNTQGEVTSSCVCYSNYDHTYSGTWCEHSDISKAKVAAIVGGVLGAFCAIFLIIIIFMCCKMNRGDKYSMSGHSNQAYNSSDMRMDKM